MTRQFVYFVQQFLKYGILQIWRQQTSLLETENILGKKLGKFNEGRLKIMNSGKLFVLHYRLPPSEK